MLKSKTMAVIFANMHDEKISSLTSRRSMGSVPVCGRYRLIDFCLSSAVRAGISQVAVITKSNYRSLMDHLGNGRDWDLARKREGLTIYPPFSISNSGSVYANRIDALFGVMELFTDSSADYVVLFDCDQMANVDLEPFVNKHIESGADITMLCTDELKFGEYVTDCSIIDVDENDRITSMRIGIPYEQGRLTTMNTCIVSRRLLIELITDAHSKMKNSVERDIIFPNLEKMDIRADRYHGFVSRICSIQSYYESNMSLLDSDNLRELLYKPGATVYTKIHDDAPVRYGLDSKVVNSLIADGCVIEGEVRNCILFRGVHIDKGAVVENSIIMQNTAVRSGSRLSYVISDKNIVISEKRTLMGYQSYPLYIEKDSVV